MTSNATSLVDRLQGRVIGRRSELEQTVASLAGGRHLLLEGPPGTGKSTMLRSLAEELDRPFVFVEGNAELTPARLIGSFDPAIVLQAGYTEEAFQPGPLCEALSSGAMLYVEEINRIPEETLNVLIGVMSEAAITVPRVGQFSAEPGFAFVAAMNPFDAVGTARIAGAIYDRVCRLEIGYQDKTTETQIVTAALGSVGDAPVEQIVALCRDTRSHPDLRSGSSVRGAIDMAVMCQELGLIRGVAPTDPLATRDATQCALSGRVRVRDGASRSAGEILEELWLRHFGVTDEVNDQVEEPSGKV